MANSYHKILIIFVIGSMATIGLESLIQIVHAQEGGQTIIRRVQIWGLFYEMMVAAFIVGAVVQGLNVYIIWRFRESHKRFKTGKNIGGSTH